jgi:hypothetical protein
MPAARGAVSSGGSTPVSASGGGDAYVPDGFGTTAGNPEAGARYGNATFTNRISVADYASAVRGGSGADGLPPPPIVASATGGGSLGGMGGGMAVGAPSPIPVPLAPLHSVGSLGRFPSAGSVGPAGGGGGGGGGGASPFPSPPLAVGGVGSGGAVLPTGPPVPFPAPGGAAWAHGR